MSPPVGAHRRLNLLTGDWVLVSPHRLARPWRGEITPPAAPLPPAHDPSCHLCPRVSRASGQVNPDYEGPWVFENDFPALLDQSEAPEGDDLLQAARETGICRVICYGPDHSRSLSVMSEEEIAALVGVWSAQTAELMARPDIGSVVIFENRGDMMGASSPHPHGQIWATRSTPNELARETDRQGAHLSARGQALLTEYAEREVAARERLIAEEGAFLAVTPFWAAWPFETLILPRRPIATLADLDTEETRSLSRLLSRLMRGYDRLFDCPFPYTFGWHQKPKGAAEGFIAHAHVYPPLLRSASIRKHMVGFEMLAAPQRDLTPEDAAARLRSACGS